MSAEIAGAVQLSINIGGNNIAVNGNFTADAGASDVALSQQQSITTTPTLVNFGDFDTVKYVFYQNKDATNYVVIGDNNSNPTTQKITKLLPGECCLLPGPATAHYAQANTAAVNLLVLVIGYNAP